MADAARTAAQPPELRVSAPPSPAGSSAPRAAFAAGEQHLGLVHRDHDHQTWLRGCRRAADCAGSVPCAARSRTNAPRGPARTHHPHGAFSNFSARSRRCAVGSVRRCGLGGWRRRRHGLYRLQGELRPDRKGERSSEVDLFRRNAQASSSAAKLTLLLSGRLLSRLSSSRRPARPEHTQLACFRAGQPDSHRSCTGRVSWLA